ncbi:MAG: ElyC/SanA/YdcF family protein [Mariniphaga sp.]
MKSFISGLLLPLPILILLILLACYLSWKKRERSARITLIISIGWFLVVSTSLIPKLLVSNLENRYKVFSLKSLAGNSKPVNILVLGAGFSDDDRFPPNNNLSETALARLCEGIRIHRLIPGSTLITSAKGWENEISQAEITAQAAIVLGVDSSRIKMQQKPENTHQEAEQYKLLFGDSAQLILVTSATHMPRAIYLFQKEGLHPVAAPANHLIKIGKHKRFWDWLPSVDNIQKMECAIHEFLGLVWAKALKN